VLAARIAGHVDHGREHLLHPACARLGRGGGEDALHEVRIPGARQRDRLRKARGLFSFQTVQRFLVKQDGDAEPCVLLHPALDGVGVFRFGPGSVALARSLDAAHADAKPVGRVRRIEPAGRVRHGPLSLPETQHLADFFLECHPAEQVVDAALDGESRIQVGRPGLRDLGGRRPREECQAE